MALLTARSSAIALTALLMTSGCIPTPDRAETRAPPPGRMSPATAKPVPAPKSAPAVAQMITPGPPPPAVSENAPVPPPPAWQVRTVTASAVEVTPSTYVVKAGDTLRRISDKTGAGSEAIAKVNDIPSPFKSRIAWS